MKRSFWIFMLLLLALSFTLISCGNDDDNNDDFDPTDMAGVNADNADWIVNITPMEAGRENDFMIMVNFTGDNTTILPTDVLVLKIDGVALSWLSSFPGYYHTQTDLTAGQSYEFSLLFNGSVKATTTMTLPYVANPSFPASFDPAAAASFSWTLSGNNQYQVAAAQSSKYVSATEHYADEYIKSISPSDRSFNVPANSIETWGAGTTLTLALYQINYKNVNRVAFMAYQMKQKVWNR
ncbi:MAG TPA: hypothetical protein P5533_03610 [Candidatus Cloacimonadota bacterium]|nr:hypothetical protein [Candidatus Cloacimonadota bacterium]